MHHEVAARERAPRAIDEVVPAVVDPDHEEVAGAGRAAVPEGNPEAVIAAAVQRCASAEVSLGGLGT